MKSASDKSTARSDRTSNNVSDTSSEGYSHRDTPRHIAKDLGIRLDLCGAGYQTLHR